MPNDPKAPVVTIAIPTGDRTIFLRQALHYALRQTAWDAFTFEIVVVDGGKRPATESLHFDRIGRGRELIRYVRVDPSTTTGERRNVCAEHARGAYIVHIDDDDWYAPTYVSTVLNATLERGADLMGVMAKYWTYDAIERRGWRTHVSNVIGAAANFCYRRSLWEKQPFHHVQRDEDIIFYNEALKRGALVDGVDREDLYVYIKHKRNVTGPTDGIVDEGLTSMPRQIIGADDLPFYDELAELFGGTQKPGMQAHLPPSFRSY
jgi:glycosyltransferase involved in cell wall biosynthesis